MEFVWDESKAALNLEKHGVSFEDAATVFQDEDALRIFDPDHSEDEDRFLLLGTSATLRILVVCHCYRENETQIRIISARKATANEIGTYIRRKQPCETNTTSAKARRTRMSRRRSKS